VAPRGPRVVPGYGMSSDPAHEERWPVRRAGDGERRGKK
jgi:hypothetical protein